VSKRILWAMTLSLGKSDHPVGYDTVALGESEDLVGCVTGQVGGSCVFIFRVEQSKTQCHVPEDLHLPQHSCENHSSWMNTCIRAQKLWLQPL